MSNRECIDNDLYSFNINCKGTHFKLYDLASWKNGLAFKNIDFSDTGKPIIKIAELNAGIGPTTAYTQNQYSPEVHLTKGDFLFSWSGNPETSIDIYRYKLQDGWLNQHIFKVVPNKKLIVHDFFFYLMKALKPNFKKIASNKQTTGLGHVTIADLKRIDVTLPSLAEQRRIAEILSSLDDKIELNNAINRNLEEQAQALFRNWFIDFAPFGGKMPGEWKEGKLSDIVNVRYGKDHKKLGYGTIPVYGSGGIMRYVNQFLYNKESVLIPRKGTLNNIFYISEPFWSVDTMFYTEMLIPNAAKFVYFFMKEKDLESLNAGSAVPSMTTDILNALPIVVPSAKALLKYEDIVSPMFKKMDGNNKESIRLAALRDTLLPKLMSGEN